MKLSQEAVIELGQAVGFDAVGVTSAQPFPELEGRLKAYRERGLTGYEWEDLAARIDPKQWMPEAKSLIAVAMAYLTPQGQQTARRHPAGGLHGQVSVYSYGTDYHLVLQDRLREFASRLEALAGHPVEARTAVDTSPLVDRRVAERAGIGWVGKNCMFYCAPYGSYVFLGTLCVDIEIPSTPVAQAAPCGSCSLCLDACPTGALIAPGVMDARRCLSYVTQMKGVIPKQYRQALGRRVWGCDTCQWACPENRDVDLSDNDVYRPQGELAYPDLLEVLHLTNRSFARKFGHTAAAWRGLRTWQRNALIALGNCAVKSSVPEIVPFLHSAREELRASAAWALEQIGTPEARQAVNDAARDENSQLVREDMSWAQS